MEPQEETKTSISLTKPKPEKEISCNEHTINRNVIPLAPIDVCPKIRNMEWRVKPVHYQLLFFNPDPSITSFKSLWNVNKHLPSNWMEDTIPEFPNDMLDLVNVAFLKYFQVPD